ncbi:MAG TPA: hypothetical protein VF120_18145 [Ktedonobacterales bacterium]
MRTNGVHSDSLRRRASLLPLICLLSSVAVLVLAGCGAAGGLYGGSGTTSAPGGTSASAPSGAGIVATASATVAGHSESILTDASGRALYYFAADSSTSSACTGACTSTWSPLIISSGTPTSNATLPGTLSAQDVGNGLQVLYNGHPLYRYAGDTAAGQTNGEGFEGQWHVATPSLAATSGASPSASPTSCGYYCGG